MRILEFIFHLSIMILSILFLYHYNIFWPKSDGTAFTLKILKAEQGNQVFSPINIAHAFGLLLLGAGGETEKEISDILGYGRSNKLLALTFHLIGQPNQIPNCEPAKFF